MADPLILFLIFLVGGLAGFWGSITGGGGLISIPLLIFFGLPPQIAIATNKFGGLGLGLGATIKFLKNKLIIWKYVPIFIILGGIGAYLGTNILLKTDERILSRIVGLILLLVLPAIFLNKKAGIERMVIKKSSKILGYFFYFLIMIFGGFFGGGTGIFSMYTLTLLFGLTILEANATDLIGWLFMSVISLIILALNDSINYLIGIFLFLGMLPGGYLGAKIAIKKGAGWVKILFTVTVILSAIKLIFF